MSNPTSYEWTTVVDNTPPTISNVVVLDAYRLRVIYSKSVVESEAVNTANYSFTGGLSVVSIEAESSTTYLVTTTLQTGGASYTLTVSNVHDLNGNLI